jgi:phage-related protein
MSAQWKDMKARVGAGLLPVMVVLAKVINRVVLPGLAGLGRTVKSVAGFISSHAMAFKVVAAILAGVLIPALVAWGVAATVNAAKNVVAWVTSAVAAEGSAAVQELSAFQVGLRWLWMGAQALLGAAKVAAAWLISLGPIAIVVAAVIAAVVLIIKYWDQIAAATVKVWNAIKAATLAAWNFIKKNLKTILEAILVIVTGPIGLLVVLIIRNWDKIKGATSAAWGAVKSTVSSIVGGIYGFVRDKFNAMVSFFSGIPGRLAHAASGMFDGIKDAFRSAINWVIGAWNGLEFSIPGFSVFGKHIGGVTIGVPDIPYLARGGLISGSGLAVVGENGPELVQLPRGARVIPNNEVSRSETALTVNNYYPKPEPSSEATPRSLREAAFTTGLAW